ncbi:MAG: NAD-dependent epimerase/dehydratase family protein [Bacteroidota bacterium]
MSTKPLRVIITGATGMVGEGVMHECLQNPDVEAVLVINRKPTGESHPKLKEILHADFFDFSAIEKDLSGYNACFFCLGVTSIGMKEPEYFKKNYTLTLHVAHTLSRLNQDMTFCYVSGAGTDSSEKGKSMWARVKGKTENDIMKLPFRDAYAFRPGFIKAIPGLKRTNKLYKYVSWLFPIGRALYAKGFCTLRELAAAMIFTAKNGYSKKVIEGKDIIELAKK